MFLSENSLYANQTDRAGLLGDKQKIATMFYLNFVGFLGLLKIDDKTGAMVSYIAREKKLRPNTISDDNNDMSLVVKLALDAGVIMQTAAVQATKLLVLIKTKKIAGHDIDENRVRDILRACRIQTHRPHQRVYNIIQEFIDGKHTLQETAGRIYKIAKLPDFTDMTGEWRDLVTRGGYVGELLKLASPAAAATPTVPPITAAAAVTKNGRTMTASMPPHGAQTGSDADYMHCLAHMFKLRMVGQGYLKRFGFDVTFDSKRFIETVQRPDFVLAPNPSFPDWGKHPFALWIKRRDAVAYDTFVKAMANKGNAVASAAVAASQTVSSTAPPAPKARIVTPATAPVWSAEAWNDLINTLDMDQFRVKIKKWNWTPDFVREQHRNKKLADAIKNWSEVTVGNHVTSRVIPVLRWISEKTGDKSYHEGGGTMVRTAQLDRLAKEGKIKEYFEKRADFRNYYKAVVKHAIAANTNAPQQIEDLGLTQSYQRVVDAAFALRGQPYRVANEFPYILSLSNVVSVITNSHAVSGILRAIAVNGDYHDVWTVYRGNFFKLSPGLDRQTNETVVYQNEWDAAPEIVRYIYTRLEQAGVIKFKRVVLNDDDVEILELVKELKESGASYKTLGAQRLTDKWIQNILPEKSDKLVDLYGDFDELFAKITLAATPSANSDLWRMRFYAHNIDKVKRLPIGNLNKTLDWIIEHKPEVLDNVDESLVKDIFNGYNFQYIKNVARYLVLHANARVRGLIVKHHRLSNITASFKKDDPYVPLLDDLASADHVDTGFLITALHDKGATDLAIEVMRRNRDKIPKPGIEFPFNIFYNSFAYLGHILTKSGFYYLPTDPEWDEVVEEAKKVTWTLDLGGTHMAALKEWNPRLLDVFMEEVKKKCTTDTTAALAYAKAASADEVADFMPKALDNIRNITEADWNRNNHLVGLIQTVANNTDNKFGSMAVKKAALRTYARITDSMTVGKVEKFKIDAVNDALCDLLEEVHKTEPKFADLMFSKMRLTTRNRLIKRLGDQRYMELISKELYNYPIKPEIQLTPDKIKTILKYNKLDISAVPKKGVKKISDIEKSIEAGVSAVGKLKVEETGMSDAEHELMTLEIHKLRSDAHGQFAMKVLKTYNVNFPGSRERIEAFKRAHPNTEVLPRVFHGTGSIAASMILRNGFVIVPSRTSAVQVTGRMLGDGIYFSTVSNKAAQYVSDEGFGRRFGTRGYLFEMEAAIGEPYKHHRSAGIKGATNGGAVSPEWAVFDPKNQLRIYRVHYIELISPSELEQIAKKHGVQL